METCGKSDHICDTFEAAASDLAAVFEQDLLLPTGSAENWCCGIHKGLGGSTAETAGVAMWRRLAWRRLRSRPKAAGLG